MTLVKVQAEVGKEQSQYHATALSRSLVVLSLFRHSAAGVNLVHRRLQVHETAG
jgi:hypothetical protein